MLAQFDGLCRFADRDRGKPGLIVEHAFYPGLKAALGPLSDAARVSGISCVSQTMRKGKFLKNRRARCREI